MSTRRTRFIVVLLLAISAAFVAAGPANNSQQAFGAPSITPNKTFAARGSLVTFTGSSFTSTDNGCTVAFQDRNGLNATLTTKTCTMSSGSVSGSFVIPGPLSPINNPYTIIVEGTFGGNKNNGDLALATFTVTAIAINPSSGARGQTVVVNGSLGGSDTTCSLSGSVVGTQSCVISGSSGGNFTASFVVANVVPGPYTVRATGSPSGVFVEATFTVRGPSITLRIAPGLYTSTLLGSIGDSVGVNGTDFSFADTTCTITSPSLSSAVKNPACSIIAGSGKPLGNFTIGNVAPGSYVIRVTGSSSDFAEATLVIGSGPSIILTPTSGQIGKFINVAGTGFVPSDISCTIGGSAVLTPACSVVPGSGKPKGNFTIGNVAPGSYLITLTGNTGDFAQAVLTVKLANGTLVLSPTSGITGTTVTFRATGFLGGDTGCVVQSADGNGAPGSNNLLITSATCAMGSQVAIGTFVVGTLATTNIKWNVTVKGTPANEIPVGEWALFNVTAQIILSPTQGTNGTVVGVTGTGFSSMASTICTLGVTPAVNFTDRLCGISGSTGHVSASFRVFNAVAGFYLINVTDSKGFFAGATFQVGAPSANITLSPNTLFAPPGGFVGVSGSGFNPQDTTCMFTPIGLVFTVSTCTISSGFVAGSITVLPTAPPGLYAIVVTGNKGDFAFNFLGVNAVTTQTSTLVTTSVSTTATSTSTTLTTTGLSTSFSTTTLQTTGFSTWIFTSRTATTLFGETTTTVVSTFTTSSIFTFLTSTTVTTTTTITHTLGQIIQPAIQAGFYPDALGVLALLSLAIPLLFRRLVD